MVLKKYKIGDILELQRGYDLPSSQMEDGDVLVAGSNGIIGTHNVARGKMPCITVGRSGSVGKVHFYEQPVWAHNTSLFVKDYKGNDPKYLFYFLRNLHLDEIFGKSSSVVPSLDRKVVHAMTIPFQDDIDKQKNIAHTLSLLDEKIALNRAINDNLEAMAKQLYDYWFVQFDFPNEEGKPYKSSGGKMVWNEKLKQEIPDGWSDSTLSEICVMYQPQTIGTDLLLPNGVYRVYGANGIVGKYDQYNHEDSEIAMACRGNSCGVVNRTMPYSWITGNAMVLQMKDKGVSNEYIKQSVSYMNISGAISGSGQPQLTRENLNIVKCLKPAHNVLLSFSQLIEPIVTAQLHIIEENDKITKLRDDLLPLLMNGQVSVNYHLSDD